MSSKWVSDVTLSGTCFQPTCLLVKIFGPGDLIGTEVTSLATKIEKKD